MIKWQTFLDQRCRMFNYQPALFEHLFTALRSKPITALLMNPPPISTHLVTPDAADSFNSTDVVVFFTAPPDIEGNSESATVVDLVPYTEYEFRVMATNTLGTGDPSDASQKVTTLESGECPDLRDCLLQ